MFEPELADPNKEINFVDHEKDFESQRDLTSFYPGQMKGLCDYLTLRSH